MYVKLFKIKRTGCHLKGWNKLRGNIVLESTCFILICSLSDKIERNDNGRKILRRSRVITIIIKLKNNGQQCIGKSKRNCTHI